MLVALSALACGFGSVRAMGQGAAAAPQATLRRLGVPVRGAFTVATLPSADTILWDLVVDVTLTCRRAHAGSVRASCS